MKSGSGRAFAKQAAALDNRRRSRAGQQDRVRRGTRTEATVALVLVSPKRHRHRALLCCRAQCALARALSADTRDDSSFWNQGMRTSITTIASIAANSGFLTP